MVLPAVLGLASTTPIAFVRHMHPLTWATRLTNRLFSGLCENFMLAQHAGGTIALMQQAATSVAAGNKQLRPLPQVLLVHMALHSIMPSPLASHTQALAV